MRHHLPTPLVVGLCALAAILSLPASAGAIDIAHHYTVQVRHEAWLPTLNGGGRHRTVWFTREERITHYDVAPPYVPPAPTPAAPVSTSVAPSTPTSSTVAPSVGLPTCTWQPESGGDPNIVSVYSGGGYYGILDSSWAAYGDPAYAHPYDAPLSVQTQAAQAIWDAQGAAAWANC